MAQSFGTYKKVQCFGNQNVRGAAVEAAARRWHMEDYHCIVLNLENHVGKALFAIFDGHGGTACAEYMSRNLPLSLNKLPNLDEESIQKVVDELDSSFRQESKNIPPDPRFSPCAAVPSPGSTMIAAILDFNSSDTIKIQTINLGDSRCMLARDGVAIDMSNDHKPNDPSESERIIAAGGRVLGNRVNGDLLLSRAFGDFYLKDVDGLSPHQQKVSTKVDFSYNEIQRGSQDYLLLTCDGLVETLKNQDLITFIDKEITTALEKGIVFDPAVATAKLVQYAYDSHSFDNLSAILILFENGVDYHQEKIYLFPDFDLKNQVGLRLYLEEFYHVQSFPLYTIKEKPVTPSNLDTLQEHELVSNMNTLEAPTKSSMIWVDA